MKKFLLLTILFFSKCTFSSENPFEMITLVKEGKISIVKLYTMVSDSVFINDYLKKQEKQLEKRLEICDFFEQLLLHFPYDDYLINLFLKHQAQYFKECQREDMMNNIIQRYHIISLLTGALNALSGKSTFLEQSQEFEYGRLPINTLRVIVKYWNMKKYREKTTYDYTNADDFFNREFDVFFNQNSKLQSLAAGKEEFKEIICRAFSDACIKTKTY